MSTENLESEINRLDRKNDQVKDFYQTKYLGERERLKVEKVYTFFKNYLSNIDKKGIHDQLMNSLKSENQELKNKLSKSAGRENGPLLNYLEAIWKKRF